MGARGGPKITFLEHHVGKNEKKGAQERCQKKHKFWIDLYAKLGGFGMRK